MFCAAVISAPHFGQAERGTTRLYLGCGSACSGCRSGFSPTSSASLEDLLRLRTPLAFQHDRNAVDDDVEEAADQQAEDEDDRDPGRGYLLDDLRERGQTAAPSLKIGRYIAMTRPPTSTPRIAMISGSSKLLIASTAASTSAS